MRKIEQGAGFLLSQAQLSLEGDRVFVLTPGASDFKERMVYQYQSKYFLFPGFVDVHVHLREPGFSYKETIATGTAAAARGGYTAVCAMPNLSPVPDSAQNLGPQLEAIRKAARVSVYPIGAITKGEAGETLADMAAMAEDVIGFSDDGKGVQSDAMMRAAMCEAKRLGRLITAHCEDECYLDGGYIHDGAYARAHGHRGISSKSEWAQIERDIALVRETGCRYHVCHVSTKEGVALVRQAKAEGLTVTCETAPHYLLLTDDMLQEDGRFKVNPPIRAEEDRQALLEGLLDGTVDCIITDHAPHSAEEKAGGLKNSMMGFVGLEVAFAALYTGLVMPGTLSLERLVELLSASPRTCFGLPGGLEQGDFTVFELDTPYIVDPAEFLSKGKTTPFAGNEVYGRCMLTVHKGKIAYKAEEFEL